MIINRSKSISKEEKLSCLIALSYIGKKVSKDSRYYCPVVITFYDLEMKPLYVEATDNFRKYIKPFRSPSPTNKKEQQLASSSAYLGFVLCPDKLHMMFYEELMKRELGILDETDETDETDEILVPYKDPDGFSFTSTLSFSGEFKEYIYSWDEINECVFHTRSSSFEDPLEALVNKCLSLTSKESIKDFLSFCYGARTSEDVIDVHAWIIFDSLKGVKGIDDKRIIWRRHLKELDKELLSV